MDCIIYTAVFLSVFETAFCFNIEPVAWQVIQKDAAGFGYQVVQRRSDLLISAPFEQHSSDRRGQIYRCSGKSCQLIDFQIPDAAVNMSLGLTMTSDPRSQNTLVCGPTIPKDCKSITMYRGACFQIERFNGIGTPLTPFSLQDCRDQADIAFLLDGSGSVNFIDFATMKNFVKGLVRSFLTGDTKFAVVQFSNDVTVHFYFDDFSSGSSDSNIDSIAQRGGGTNTATAIREVVQNVFTPSRGSRSNVKKILIVITDGASQQRRSLPGAADLAEKQNIVRFAIGVGSAFRDPNAKSELDTIASSPSQDHVFQVENFNALEKIRQSLQAKIFAIEGSQSGGESIKMEMAQEGFSAVYAPGEIQMAIIGANQWRGGFLRYTTSDQKQESFEPTNIEPDSYMGYSMSVAQTPQGLLTVTGAPRYNHRGAVFTVFGKFIQQKIDPFPWEFQIGEYFGAEVCTMDVNGDSYTDLILISAPMYKDSDREGRVYVCLLSRLRVICDLETPSVRRVLRGAASVKGRFGSSLAVLPDLNADGFSDLAVGAPLENDGQGSIYIYNSEGIEGISSTYTQRIAASEVQQGLKYFGMSISQSSFDQSGDNLPDLAVGSKGGVVLLRSRPVVMVETSVSFSPNQIPTQNTDCSKPLEITARLCFTMTRRSAVNTAQAKINYTFILDATRKVPNNRAYITEKQRDTTGSFNILLDKEQCINVKFFVEPCPEDALNVVKNELRFTFDGVPSNTNLKPSLARQAQTRTFHDLNFEISCGTDNECVDNLKVDFNFTGSSEVKVGIDELLSVTVSVENSGENSYNSRVILTYPAGLSYRKFTIVKGRIECNSDDSEDGVSRGKTDCTVDKPIFKSNTKVFFIVSYGIDANSRLNRSIFVTANVTSGNQAYSSSRELYKMKPIDVKYGIFATFESSLSYSNFTFGHGNLQKPVLKSLKITNDLRALNLTVVIRVPVKLGDKDIWVDSDNLQVSFEMDCFKVEQCLSVMSDESFFLETLVIWAKEDSDLPIPNCHTDKDIEPKIADFVDHIQKHKLVDCSVAKCRVFKCSSFMGRLESKQYKISANLSSSWIEQIGLQSAKFLLTSTASLEYDTNQYIFFSTGSSNNPPIRKIETEVEVNPEVNFTKEIVGGSLGGLALLALLTAGLYKAGFFKSKYKDMINEAGEGADPGGDGDASPLEEQA